MAPRAETVAPWVAPAEPSGTWMSAGSPMTDLYHQPMVLGQGDPGSGKMGRGARASTDRPRNTSSSSKAML